MHSRDGSCPLQWSEDQGGNHTTDPLQDHEDGKPPVCPSVDTVSLDCVQLAGALLRFHPLLLVWEAVCGDGSHGSRSLPSIEHPKVGAAASSFGSPLRMRFIVVTATLGPPCPRDGVNPP